MRVALLEVPCLHPCLVTFKMKFGNDADNLVQLVEVSIESFGLTGYAPTLLSTYLL